MTVSLSLRPTPRVLLSGFVGAGAVASGIALTATSGWLIVRASEGPQILLLLTAIVAVRAFGMARPALYYLERLLSHDAALADLARRREQVYAALVPLTPARLGRRARSDLLGGVVDDLSDVVDVQVRVTVPLLSAAGAAALAVGLTALVSPAAALVLLGLVLVVAVACVAAWVVETAGQDALLAARADVLRVSDLATRQAAELAAVGGTATALGWVDAAHVRLRRAVRRQSRGRALVAAVTLSATGLATLGSALVAAGAGLSAPVTALLVVVPVATGDALGGLVDTVRALARAQAARDRLGALTSQPPAVADRGTRASGIPLGPQTAPAPPTIRLRGVSAEWHEGSTALAPVDLDLAPGSRTAIVGSNGSGKSTLLAVLARQLDPAEGSYTLDGVDATALDLEEVRSLVAVVDDEPHIFATTLRDNLRVAAPDADDEAVEDALRAARLGPWLDALPLGLDTRLGAGGHGVSGGERARIALARALVSRRPVVLLDEPVAHLDHVTAVAVTQDVLATTRGRTVVLVSHRPEGLAEFDDVIDVTPANHARPRE